MEMLPDELWESIFYLATYNPLRDLEDLLNPFPFEGIERARIDREYEIALSTKYSLALVCSHWRSHSMRFLLEDIRIRHGSGALADRLETGIMPYRGKRLGSYVKRVVIPLALDDIPNSNRQNTFWQYSIGKNTARILRSCQNIIALARDSEIFLKPHAFNCDLLLETADDLRGIELPNLVRAEWNPGYLGFSGGLMASKLSIPAFLRDCLTLHVLSLRTVGPGYHDPLDWNQARVPFPNVHTFRIGAEITVRPPSSNEPGSEGNGVFLPSLRHVILHNPLGWSTPLLACNLKSISSLELHNNMSFLHRVGSLRTLLTRCPKLESLYLPIFFISPLLPSDEEDDRGRTTVKVVGLHAVRNQVLEGPLSNTYWDYINGHFRALCNSQGCLPSLKEIQLFGEEWIEFLCDSRFERILSLAREKRIQVTGDLPQVSDLLSELDLNRMVC